jgi:hypothetical protein
MPSGQDGLLISANGRAEKLAAKSPILDGFELMFQGTPSRNARHAGFADSAYPAREYGR